MSFVNLSRPPLDHRSHSAPHTRPRFNSQNTSDRLREGSGLRPRPFGMVSNIKKDRKSMFKEVGLEDDFSDEDMPGTPTSQHARDRKGSVSSEKEFGDAGELVSERTRSSNDDSNGDGDGDGDGEYGRRAETGRHEQSSNPQRQNSMQVGKPAWYTKLRRPKIKSVSSAPPPTVASLQRFAMIALIIAVILPAFSYSNGGQKVGSGADAGVIRPRQTTSTDVCLRWSQQGRSPCTALIGLKLTGSSRVAQWDIIHIRRTGQDRGHTNHEHLE